MNLNSNQPLVTCRCRGMGPRASAGALFKHLIDLPVQEFLTKVCSFYFLVFNFFAMHIIYMVVKLTLGLHIGFLSSRFESFNWWDNV